jgi:hypothetical protein
MLDGYHSLTNGYRLRAHIAEARVEELEAELTRLRRVEERIAEAADRRPDGTFNIGRNALRQIARDALRETPDVATRAES